MSIVKALETLVCISSVVVWCMLKSYYLGIEIIKTKFSKHRKFHVEFPCITMISKINSLVKSLVHITKLNYYLFPIISGPKWGCVLNTTAHYKWQNTIIRISSSSSSWLRTDSRVYLPWFKYIRLVLIMESTISCTVCIKIRNLKKSVKIILLFIIYKYIKTCNQAI